MALYDPALHDPKQWVVDSVLRRQSRTRGDETCIHTTAGDSITFSRAQVVANQVARFLQSLHVAKGDTVAVMLPNGLDYCNAWFGISRLGAIHVAINTDYKGAFLKHVLNNSRAHIIITEPGFFDRIAEIEDELSDLTEVITIGAVTSAKFRRLRIQNFGDYVNFNSSELDVSVTYRDLACIMYTSGTTGPAKGVLMPHAHTYLFGLGTIENMRLTESDTFYIVLPLFHANAMFMQLYASLIIGCTAVIRNRFSASAWIHDINHYQATITNSLGVVSTFVLNQPPSGMDKNHRLHTIGVAPNLPELDAKLRERFAIKNVIGLYGMTEVNIPLYTQPGLPRPGSCGKVWEKYYDVKIVDPETDDEMPVREVGEIVVRPKQPFGFMAGYNAMPGKTVEAWRNFWFHTGDAAWMDNDGYVYFVDRIKDCIRRRGENISSFEIEEVICRHTAIAEVAAVAVESPIPGGEDEVKVVVVLDPGQQLGHEDLVRYCEQHMPRFAVPRYIEFIASLPKTPTSKVRKNLLRQDGVTPATWDREAKLS